MKHQANFAGKMLHSELELSQKLNSAWLEDVVFRVLKIFCLDRFCDFVSDQVVVPVRETCAQILGIVSRNLPDQVIFRALEIFRTSFFPCKQWEARHAAFLGFKYILASVRQDLALEILGKFIKSLEGALDDTFDDVRAAAADCLVAAANPEAISKLLSHSELQELWAKLWGIMLELDDLSASTASVLKLIGLTPFPSLPFASLHLRPPYVKMAFNNNNNNKKSNERKIRMLGLHSVGQMRFARSVRFSPLAIFQT